MITPRHIHADFHTSELMENIGERYSKEDFQRALKIGNVASIVVFAKCHHSNFYYPTKIGRMHPHLKFDLMGSMIEACHEIGVKAPIYYTVGWSAQDALAHKDWWTKGFGVETPNNLNYDIYAKPDDPKPFTSWINLCINNPDYQKQIFAEVEEICTNYPVDGFFFDIMFNDNECDCHACRKGMKELGMNPDKIEDSRKYLILKRREFQKNIVELVHKHHKDAEVFFNMADMYKPEFLEFNTHFEIEDNPQIWEGYDKMPVRAKYFSRLRKPYMAQSGKFHTSWGEYAGFKNPLALKYEAAAMLTYGARIGIGDQIHPSGEMDLQTYKNIGVAFEYAKQIEEYCLDTLETSRLGLFLSDNAETDSGMTRMLFETQLDFDIILDGESVERYDTIIIPPGAKLSADMRKKVNEHIRLGKGVLLMGDGAVEDGKFVIDCGFRYLGHSPFDYDYVKAGEPFADFPLQSPYLFYSTANEVECPEDAVVCATVREPFFTRTYRRYCSHQNTPYKLEDAAYPAVAVNGNVAYVAHNTPKIYFDYGCQYHRDLTIRALREVYKNPVMKVEGLMSSGRSRFVYSPDKNRYVFHALYVTPSKRGIAQVLEDFPYILDTKVDLEVAHDIRKVRLMPQDVEIPFVKEGNRVKFTIDKFNMHQMVVLDY
ncbi:MAG: hypothetical protein ACI4S9_08205 [Christensenellales bacterium]